MKDPAPVMPHAGWSVHQIRGEAERPGLRLPAMWWLRTAAVSMAMAMIAALPARADAARDPAVPLVPLPAFDRADLLGDWFEVVQMPTILERDCHATRVRVELRDDSRLNMLIACHVGAVAGPVLPIDGIMVETSPGVFVVRMVRLPQLGSLPLVVIWQAPDASLVALAAPLGEVGWIWARSARPDSALLDEARRAMIASGYRAAAMRDVPH